MCLNNGRFSAIGAFFSIVGYFHILLLVIFLIFLFVYMDLYTKIQAL
ncbi:hypothetical protein GCHA_3947 [Paraglaciecola chathamensis S18K6]|uniref:Uncharacterized protein n=1 Tax=Paraglaciecola chathamensis S18K6 TaxID=1127672 RepID=A0AAV3V5C6_9ALTE|nr:hypothetical protein GCHA_3947 [Paraglaciecola chathamensis S18K6]